MAWKFQQKSDVAKLGARNAPWHVGWRDPAGRLHRKKIGLKAMASKFMAKVEADKVAGICGDNRHTWTQFRDKFEAEILASKPAGTQGIARDAFQWFEKLCKPRRMAGITTETIDSFRSKLCRQPGKKQGSNMAPATVNKHLRQIKAALRKEHRWGYLPQVPDFEMMREPDKLVSYVTPEDFAAIYEAAEVSTMPKGLPYEPADWWRALLMFCYMTGWRISEPLALVRDDLDLLAGTAITSHHDDKGNRDDIVKLHPVAIEHLERIASFHPEVFPWYHDRRTLDDEYHRIQRAAGIKLHCREKHEHTPACHVYGFHDLRRAFATMNAKRLTADELQRLMRHKSYLTTRRYINMASRLDQAVDQLYVPAVKQA